MSETKSILIIGCFDTKGQDFAYLRNRIIKAGERVITVNTGIMGACTEFTADIEADTVAAAAGHSLEQLRSRNDRGYAIDVMGKGAAQVVAALVADNKIKGAISMGGGGGTYIALSAMQPVPFGIPKFCLSTAAAKDLSRQIGSKDITLMPSIVDVAGINSISSILIQQVAAAICAMANAPLEKYGATRGSVAISMFGNTTACVDTCSALLRGQGYEVMAFHANGAGGRTMEALIADNCFDAVLDITTTELADELCHGICSAGPDRLKAAAKAGIPQVVVPGCLDMVNFAQPDTVPGKYKNRRLYSWAPDVTLMRTNTEENEILGRQLAERVNQSKAPAAILIPAKGISQVNVQGGIFYDPDADKALISSIRKFSSPAVKVTETELHINDAAFAALAVETLLNLMKKK
ncbi:MAG: Tm-1-like ATP-binding domain-containing protein [Chitinophagaceae bacterium]|nr:Tm-1-like ATP-binding domain-containing protein [Chitinophagaceae bacterium]MCW5925531.1 Tm-1-like ATP-binding domain-containing protein [Chitinophagaceae bacterium]